TWWRISTPEVKGDNFHQTVEYAKKSAPQKLMVIDWRADPRRTDEWFAGRLLENGGNLTWDAREQQFNCSFAGVSGLRIFKADAQKITYTDADLPDRARKLWPIYLPMDFGSGPSWTVCLFILVNWERGKEYPDGKGGVLKFPEMWLDRELVWQRTPVLDIGNAIMQARAEYSDMAWHFGDPAGRNVESDQESWESNLNMAGVPIRCLDGAYNSETLRDESIIECQTMMDRGLFRIHERCTLFLAALESWEWNVPAGIKIEMLNRADIKPMKDGWSHPMDAFRYAVSAALRMGLQAYRAIGETQDLPEQPGGKIAKMLAATANGRPHKGSDGPPVEFDAF
ncbi:MAG TPA: hypothetical protein VLJ83_09100, partial [Gemmatimonadaceae bacterium]|nr:hypothetical protein [Gemmatimonadaceae bacterium]